MKDSVYVFNEIIKSKNNILRIINKHGKYYIQRKTFLFWRNFEYCRNRYFYYNTLNEAIDAIERDCQ